MQELAANDTLQLNHGREMPGKIGSNNQFLKMFRNRLDKVVKLLYSPPVLKGQTSGEAYTSSTSIRVSPKVSKV